MMQSPAATDRIAESMRRPITQYVALISDLAGERVQGLTFFGAVVAGVFDSARHTARNVLVMDEIDLSVLKRLAPHGPALGKTAISAPLVMTPRYIETSMDTFPLEFIEIQQMHVTVLGQDCFDSLTFENAHVRLQCERELKVLQIGLRQGLLASAGREACVDALEQDVGEGLLRTLRGMLWLKGMHDSRPAGAVLDEVEKLIDQRLDGVRTALDAKATHGWSAFEQLYRNVERLGEVVDAW